MGIERIAITLHIGAGTFLPVKVDDTAGARIDLVVRDDEVPPLAIVENVHLYTRCAQIKACLNAGEAVLLLDSRIAAMCPTL